MERINLDKSQLIKVGSTVYLKPINNAARYGRKDILEKVVLKREGNISMLEIRERQK